MPIGTDCYMSGGRSHKLYKIGMDFMFSLNLGAKSPMV